VELQTIHFQAAGWALIARLGRYAARNDVLLPTKMGISVVDSSHFIGVALDRIRQALLVEEGIDLMLWRANAWVTSTHVSG